MITELSRIRNVGLFAPTDSGQNTLARRIIERASNGRAIPRVQDGEHQDHSGHRRNADDSFDGKVMRCDWRDHHLHIVPSRIASVPNLQPADDHGLEAVVVAIDAASGLPRSLTRNMIPALPLLVFVNKCDRMGANPQRVCEQLREQLGLNPVMLHMPQGLEQEYQAAIDLVSMTCHDHQAPKQISSAYLPAAKAARAALVEAIAMHYDELLTPSWEQDIPTDDLVRITRRATLEGKIVPVLVGSALQDVGVDALLDAVVSYLPSPTDREQDSELSRSSELSLVDSKASPEQPRYVDDDASTSILAEDRDAILARSAIRLLEAAIDGELDAGELGIVVSPPGVGKTACLVQLALDSLLRNRCVHHIAIGGRVSDIEASYAQLFGTLASKYGFASPEQIYSKVTQKLYITVYAHRDDLYAAMQASSDLGEVRTLSPPDVTIVDGYPWTESSSDQVRTLLDTLSGQTTGNHPRLWISVNCTKPLHAISQSAQRLELTETCSRLLERADIALGLADADDQIHINILKSRDDLVQRDTQVRVHPQSRCLIEDPTSLTTPLLPRSAFMLVAGGASGAEAFFGECAERWGLNELHYSYPGRKVSRQRGLVELDDEALEQGSVVEAYIERAMQRSYPRTPEFKNLFPTIWHQVQGAAQVFSIGTLLPDKTLKGGTGWAVQLARLWHKPLYVFDQEDGGWYQWADKHWLRAEAPIITAQRFCGTGTRRLNGKGREAIRGLFERSFGPI